LSSLKALLHVMRDDQWEGKGLAHPELRNCSHAKPCWGAIGIAARLAAKQQIDRRLWRRHIDYLDDF